MAKWASLCLGRAGNFLRKSDVWYWLAVSFLCTSVVTSCGDYFNGPKCASTTGSCHDLTLETWIRKLQRERGFRIVDENYPAASHTPFERHVRIVLVNTSSPTEFQVGVRQYDLTERPHHTIVGKIECLRQFDNENTGINLSSVGKIRWYFNDQRIRHAFHGPFLLTGKKKSILDIHASGKFNDKAMFSGQYRCDVLNGNRSLILRKTFSVMFFAHPDNIKHPPRPSFAFSECHLRTDVKVVEIGLTWAKLEWKLPNISVCNAHVSSPHLGHVSSLHIGHSVTIKLPADQGFVNYTGLRMMTRQRLRIKTYVQKWLDVYSIWIKTDGVVRLRCDRTRARPNVGPQGRGIHCHVSGQPFPTVLSSVPSTSIDFADGGERAYTYKTFTWKGKDMTGNGTHGFCIKVYNKYGLKKKCFLTP